MNFNSKTVVRWVESFIIILVVNFLAMFTIGGQPVDISTPEGRTATFSAVVAAVAIAIRRAMAANSANAQTPTPPTSG